MGYKKTQEWHENKVKEYHKGKVEVLSKYNSPRQIELQKSRQRDIEENNYCKEHNIPLCRMDVPFKNFNTWNYDDYYRYINTELKTFVKLAKQEVLC